MARKFSSAATQTVQVNDHADLDATTSITVAAWVRWDSAEVDQPKHVVSKWNNYALRMSLRPDFSGFMFIIFSGAAEFNAAVGTPTANVWYHMVGRFDGSTVKIDVYNSVTGASIQGTQARTGSIDTGANNLHIGNYEGLLDIFDLQGSVADVRIWKNVALSDGDLIHIRSRPYENFKSPVLNMPLGRSSPEVDLSGNAHTGAVTGATVADNPPTWTTFARTNYVYKYVAVSGFKPFWALKRSNLIGAR